TVLAACDPAKARPRARPKGGSKVAARARSISSVRSEFMGSGRDDAERCRARGGVDRVGVIGGKDQLGADQHDAGSEHNGGDQDIAVGDRSLPGRLRSGHRDGCELRHVDSPWTMEPRQGGQLCMVKLRLPVSNVVKVIRKSSEKDPK